MGPASEDDKEGRVLNRMVRWSENCLEYEGDPRQVERLVRELGLEGAKPVATPGVKASHEQIETDAPIDPDQVSHFRGLAARCNYLSQDRPDCQFSAKEICRFMSDPTKLGVEALKRLGRYLVKRRRLVFLYPWQEEAWKCMRIRITLVASARENRRREAA